MLTGPTILSDRKGSLKNTILYSRRRNKISVTRRPVVSSLTTMFVNGHYNIVNLNLRPRQGLNIQIKKKDRELGNLGGPTMLANTVDPMLILVIVPNKNVDMN